MEKKTKKNKKSIAAGIAGALVGITLISAAVSGVDSSGGSEASFSGDRQTSVIQTAAPTIAPDASDPSPVFTEDPVESLEASPNTAAPEPTPDPTPQPTQEPTPKPSEYTYQFVASRESDKYHRPNCRWVGNIKKENIIQFETAEKAAAAGYKACGTCKPQ